MKIIQSVNPYSGEVVGEYSLHSDEEVNDIIKRASLTFHRQQKSDKAEGLNQRCERIKDLSRHLENEKMKLAKLMTMEMGKPISQSIGEIEKCAWLCRYYAEKAPEFLADDIISTDADRSWVSKDGLGVVLGVMPWNFPFWQVFRFAVPTYLSGNTLLLKHSSLVTGSALAIRDLFLKIGCDSGVFQVLVIPGRRVAKVIENEAVRAVSLTGSEAAGRSVAAVCGQNIKPSLLELGGNNAALILNDADVDRYIDAMVWARFQNAGQSCIAAKRFIVLPDIYDEFVDKFTRKCKDLVLGNPMDNQTQLATMASTELAEELAGQVKTSIQQGSVLTLGGQREGAFYSPTILENVEPGNLAFEEELFGPVAAIVKAENIEEGIELVNRSKFGLGLSIFTEDVAGVSQYLPQINEGAVFFNELVKSDPRLPFGGVKNSGYGRELAEEGLMAFVNKKTVYIK
ncbi:NAD-dependent succinate-semialdehyde dehydrogenase [Membranihabitans marinus]|uniref:NAD-dependent succinate-semialdehyde dehydrogenase n=1 Tax=Membranihabitans marinus TaxID=1227546 RepID=UPI001F42C1C0|nr:NAD-dependent succinate-semialdehyde dehydrogenase [Membranihabitans marinus]